MLSMWNRLYIVIAFILDKIITMHDSPVSSHVKMWKDSSNI